MVGWVGPIGGEIELPATNEGGYLPDGTTIELFLIEEIFAPPVVAPAQHAHDLATGVEGERPRVAHEDHVVDFVEHAVAFAAIASMAAGDEILPGRVSAPGAGNHVVESELAGGQNNFAVLAGIAIAEKDVFTGEGTRLMRDAAVLKQADD